MGQFVVSGWSPDVQPGEVTYVTVEDREAAETAANSALDSKTTAETAATGAEVSRVAAASAAMDAATARDEAVAAAELVTAPTDDVVASFVNDEASSTSTAMDGKYAQTENLTNPDTPEGAVIAAVASTDVSVSAYGAVGDGVTDDTSAIQAAIDAVPNGTRLVAPKGSTFRTSGWTVVDKTIHFDFEDAAIVMTGANPILTATGTWGTPVTASAVASGADTVNVSSSASFAIGDLVKVYSDDVIPDARPGDHLDTNDPTTTSYFARMGEMVVVTGKPNGTSITITPRVRDAYATNVRVAKMSDAVVTFKFGSAINDLAATSTAMFRFRGLKYPTVKGIIRRTVLAAVGVRSCYGADIDIAVNNLPTSTGGYGVSNSGSVMSRIRLVGSKMRHAYTDDVAGWQLNGSPSTDPSDYGRAMYDSITGHVMASSDTAFDTHHGGFGHKFHDCVAVGISLANQTPCYSLRGEGHELVNCTAEGADVGFRLQDEGIYSWATSKNHRMIGCISRRTRRAIDVDLDNLITAAEGYNLVVDGGVFESHDGSAIRVINGRVHLADPVFRHIKDTRPSANNTFLYCGVAHLTGKATINAAMLASGSVLDCVISFSNSPSSVQTVDLDLDVSLGAWGLANTTNLIKFETAIGQVRFVLDGTSTAQQVANTTLMPDQQSVTVRTRGADDGSGVRTFTLAAAGIVSFLAAADPTVLVRIAVTASRTSGAVRPGAYGGQVLVLYALPANAAFTVTIPHGPTYNTDLGGSNAVLAAGQMLRLVWDPVAAVWLKLA